MTAGESGNGGVALFRQERGAASTHEAGSEDQVGLVSTT
jgi:hypothetical protein